MPRSALIGYAVALGIAALAATAMAVFVARFATRWLALGPRASRVVALALASWMLALGIGRVAGRAIGHPIFAALAIAGTLGLVATLAAAALFAGVAAVRRLARRPVLAPACDDATSRRTFLARAATGAVVGGAAALGAHGIFGVRRAWSLDEIVVRIPGLPRALEGYAIAHLSDLHLGLYSDERAMRAAEELVRRARADAVAITGDLVDHHPRDIVLGARLTRRLVELGVRDGVFAIAGNHEHYVGAAEVLAALRRAGATTLRNESRPIAEASVSLLGIDDAIAGRVGYPAEPDLAAAIASALPDRPRILLAHDPGVFDSAAPHVQLQLSGHTHGGQIALAGVRPAELVLPHGYIAGLYESQGSRLYVSRGFGTTGPPMRLEVTPEVTRIVLVAG